MHTLSRDDSSSQENVQEKDKRTRKKLEQLKERVIDDSTDEELMGISTTVQNMEQLFELVDSFKQSLIYYCPHNRALLQKIANGNGKAMCKVACNLCRVRSKLKEKQTQDREQFGQPPERKS